MLFIRNYSNDLPRSLGWGIISRKPCVPSKCSHRKTLKKRVLSLYYLYYWTIIWLLIDSNPHCLKHNVAFFFFFLLLWYVISCSRYTWIQQPSALSHLSICWSLHMHNALHEYKLIKKRSYSTTHLTLNQKSREITCYLFLKVL